MFGWQGKYIKLYMFHLSASRDLPHFQFHTLKVVKTVDLHATNVLQYRH